VTSAHQPPPAKSALTPRQREVLELVARGKTNFELAQALGLSLEGAKYHVREILGRLGANSREEAVALWARERSGHRRWPMVLVAAVAGVGVVAGVVALVVVTLPAKESPAVEAGVAAPTAAPPACGLPTPGITSGIGGGAGPFWFPFVRLNGITYTLIPEGDGPTGVQQLPLGPRVGTVLWDVTAPYIHPCHAELDGSAAGLPAGTGVFALPGYPRSFRVVAILATGERQLYECDDIPGAQVGADVLDLRGKVTAVELRSVPESEAPGRRPTAVIDDAATLREMERLIAAAPLGDLSLDGAPILELSFTLADGSVVRRYLREGEGLTRNLRVGAAFDEIVLSYVVIDPLDGHYVGR
jgi:DNA-binding CsgD family transcriptional regulator